MCSQMTDFRPLHFKGGYPIWCADSLISQRHFAYHRSVFLDFHPLDCKIAPRRVVYQRTISGNGKRQIPESYESLGDANVSRNSLRGVSAKIPSQMNPLSQSGASGILLRGNQARGLFFIGSAHIAANSSSVTYLLTVRDRVTATRTVQSAFVCHRNRDLCPQLANPTAQLADSALSAHTAIRARLNHSTVRCRGK